MKKIFLLLLLIYWIAGAAFAAPVPIAFKAVPEESTIAFEALQEGKPVTGKFESFSTDIFFHPEVLESSKASVSIIMESVVSGYKEAQDALKDPEWFNPAVFPKALFETRKFTFLGEKRYQAEGTLTIKNSAVPVTLLFNLNEFSPNVAVIEGEAILKRLDFHIGWEKIDSVANDVKVKIKLKAVAAQP